MEGNGWSKARELDEQLKEMRRKYVDEYAAANRQRELIQSMRDALVMVSGLLEAEKYRDALDYVRGYLEGLMERGL